MFLVRNWSLDSEMKGLKGGLKHLEKSVRLNDGQAKEVQSSCIYISDSFEEISCFLLSHPGKKVATAKSSLNLTVSG